MAFQKGNRFRYERKNPNRPVRKTSYGVKLFEDQYSFLTAIAEKEGINLSQLLREMADFYIKSEQQSA